MAVLMERPQVEVFYTKDRALLREYQQVRKQVYLEGGDKFKGTLGQGKIDEFDDPDHPMSHIMVAIHQGKCIGGARLIVKEIGCKIPLPSETDNFNFIDALPKLDLAQHKFNEISRVAILPGFGFVLPKIVYFIRQKSVETQCEFGACTSTYARAVIFNRIANHSPTKAQIVKGFVLPDDGLYENVPMYLTYFDGRYECEHGLRPMQPYEMGIEPEKQVA